MIQRFFNTGTAFICIGFTREVEKQVKKEIHTGLKIIHVFMTDIQEVDDVTARRLMRTRHYTMDTGVKIIIHCSDRKIRYNLRRLLKGFPKNRDFHLSITRRNGMYFAFSPEKLLSVAINGDTNYIMR